jgi:uncharacterized membrane protein
VAAHNANARLEMFCDGVFAIALTLLIIDVRLPSMESLTSTADVWRALQHVAPSAFAFVLSFIVIFITWVNHHGNLRLVDKSSASFIYANGFMLLTVVFIPFPTSLLGAFIWTDHAAPAVVLYDAVLAIQAISWMAFGGTALSGRLLVDDASTATMRTHTNSAYGAFALYGLLAVLAVWFPVTAAIVTAVSWIVWLLLSIRMK